VFPRAPLFLRACVALASCFALLAQSARAQVVLNEIMAAASERLLQWDANGVPRLGTGLQWWEAGFTESADWKSGPGPFGYGTLTSNPVTPVATDVQASMRNFTPTLYLRRSFTASASDAARADSLQLLVEYNDGFVAYVNGVEVARRNAGPPKKFIYHDQPAYNREVFSGTAPIPTTTLTETIDLGPAASRLVAGQNSIAIQALNASAADATLYFKANLRITVAPAVNLVNHGDAWRYFVGVVEPSGNLYDPALLGAGKLTVNWGGLNFDDSPWSQGAGPIGAGAPAGMALATNLGAQVIGVTPSIYTRQVFSADAATAAETLPMQLVVQYDDGFVAYLNGVEIARRQMGLANTATPHDATAASDISPATETINIDTPAALLKAGSNVLAVQVHNYTAANADIGIRADLRTTGPTSKTLAASGSTWRYFIGTGEPVEPTNEEEEDAASGTPEGPESAVDWIELRNTSGAPVSLSGWSLSDDPAEPQKWTFPNVTLPSGGLLVVIADGLDLKPASGYLHTNFSLSARGEFVGLYSPAGALMSTVTFPRQSPFHSYARTGGGTWEFNAEPSPGAANGANTRVMIAPEPSVDQPGRFYPGSVTITLSSPEAPSATVRFTTDGTVPTESSPAVLGPLTVNASTVLRARAFLPNAVPSATITHTYLIGQSAARQSLPAVCLTGDGPQAFFRPFGIFAISPNTTTPATASAYTNGIWSQYIGNTSGSLTAPNVPPDPTAYNAPMQTGRPAERPIALEILHANATEDLRTEAGIRTAGSPFSRARYVLTNPNSATPNSASPWSLSSTVEKMQLNLFFRDELGGSPLSYPLVPGSPVENYENIRLRSGKNDISNPFIRDEFARRLLIDMGQVCARGDFVNVYLNGVFKGYYNITQRPREAFFQEARGTRSAFDVRYISAITDGDILAYNELVNFARTSNPAAFADYTGIASRLDVVNFADYLLVNVLAAMADWPGNNYVMDRERSPQGLYRFSIWDAEGGFGGFGFVTRRNTFTSELTSGNVAGESVPARLLYTQLKKSPEWRLLMADRIQKHFFADGSLTDANLTARYTELRDRILPMIRDVFGSGTNFNEFLTSWMNGTGISSRYTLSGGTTGTVVNNPGRRRVLFEGYTDDTTGGTFVPGHFVSEGLWPATVAPAFSQHGGNVPLNYQLAISNPNGSGAIYFTTNGSDPRAVGGAVQGQLYSGPITIGQSLVVKARVLGAGGEWSPLCEAAFSTPGVPPVFITEIMYHPPDIGGVDGNEFEFIELKNASGSTINLNGWTFDTGITFTFPTGATLAPGGFAVLVKNQARFTSKYPNVPIAGIYTGSLDNAGERLTLRNASGTAVFSVRYNDASPWPAPADGGGYSIVAASPNANPNPDDATNWRKSSDLGGSPGADDPSIPTPVIRINELLANAEGAGSDAVELHNPNAEPANIGGWFLSDSFSSPFKFRIPDNTVIAAGGYAVFTEADFNPAPGVGNSFAFSAAGEAVILSAADAVGNLLGYTHRWSFGASRPGVSFGPHTTGSGMERFVPLAARTFGAANAWPLVGPVMISEIMYHPASSLDAFVELRNVSDVPVPLFDPARPANTWRVIGVGNPSSEWPLPPGITLAPRQFLLLVSISPATFRAKYHVPASVPVVQYPGFLSWAGERIALQEPGVPFVDGNGQTVIPWIEGETVNYDDAPPWPLSADGGGRSLERKNPPDFADEAASWQASSANGGTPAAPAPMTFSTWQGIYFTPAQIADPAVGALNADPDRDGISNFWECAHGLSPLAADSSSDLVTSDLVTDGSDTYLSMQYRRGLGLPGFQFLADVAGPLFDWQANGVVVGAPVNTGDGAEVVTVRDNVPVSAADRRFIRLRVIGN
jgi:hypothetical protein